MKILLALIGFCIAGIGIIELYKRLFEDTNLKDKD